MRLGDAGRDDAAEVDGCGDRDRVVHEELKPGEARDRWRPGADAVFDHQGLAVAQAPDVPEGQARHVEARLDDGGQALG